MTNCHPDDPTYITISHYISSIFSIPVYAIAFLVLLFKCPSYFNSKYRNYLVVHIISGALLELHIGLFWKPVVALPVPILCSNGIASNFSAIDLQLFIYLLIITGISAISILTHRMKSAILYTEKKKIQKIPIYFRQIFHLFSFLSVFSTALINPGLNNQVNYKQKMELKYGTFPDYFWCQNCAFMVFDSIYFKIFFLFGYIAIVTAFISAGFSAFVTYRILHSSTLRLSRKTAEIQKNVLSSLIAAFLVHVILIFVPLLTYFSANFIIIDSPTLAYINFLMIQEHGACSAFTMLLTSNLLRKATRELLSVPIKHACVPKERTVQSGGARGAQSWN